MTREQLRQAAQLENELKEVENFREIKILDKCELLLVNRLSSNTASYVNHPMVRKILEKYMPIIKDEIKSAYHDKKCDLEKKMKSL